MKGAILVVMGVSGCGKSTVGRLIAAMQGWRFQEGDDLHPASNVAKMHRGVPLDDRDRAPWLVAIAEVIDRWRAESEAGIVTCSALKRAYRREIIGTRHEGILVYLEGSRELIEERLAARRGHFMPPGLLASQFATLEEPGPDEHPIIASIAPPPEEIARAVLAALAVRSAPERGRTGGACT